MTPSDVPVVGGEQLGVGGDVGVGELHPTPHTRHNDAAWRHWVEVPNPWDTFHEGGVQFLEKSPPGPVAQGAFALPTPREIRIICLIFTRRGVEQQPKNFL